MLDLNALDFKKGGGLVTVVAQDASSGQVLMVARVIPAGPACHTGAVTCFGDVAADTLAELDTLRARRWVRRAATGRA